MATEMEHGSHRRLCEIATSKKLSRGYGGHIEHGSKNEALYLTNAVGADLQKDIAVCGVGYIWCFTKAIPETQRSCGYKYNTIPSPRPPTDDS